MFDYDLLKKVATEVSELEEYNKLKKEEIKCENFRTKALNDKITLPLAVGGAVVTMGSMIAVFMDEIPLEYGALTAFPMLATLSPFLVDGAVHMKAIKAKGSRQCLIRDAYIMHKFIQDDMEKGWTLQEAHMRYKNLSDGDLLKKQKDFISDIEEHIEKYGDFDIESFIEKKENSAVDNFLNYHKEKQNNQSQSEDCTNETERIDCECDTQELEL